MAATKGIAPRAANTPRRASDNVKAPGASRLIS